MTIDRSRLDAALAKIAEGLAEAMDAGSVVEVAAPPPPPEPAPADTSPRYAVGLTGDQIRALPQVGPEWDNLLRLAGLPIAPSKTDGSPQGSSVAVCAGLAYVATGDAAYRDKVSVALDTVLSFGLTGWNYQAANRMFQGWALAGQLIGRTDPAWLDFLDAARFMPLAGNSRAATMHQTSWDWGNNHGTGARASYATICAVLGDTGITARPDGSESGLGALAKWFRAFCGDKSLYGCWPDGSRAYGGLGKTDAAYSNSWTVDPADWAPINQSSAMMGYDVGPKDGLLNAETFRESRLYSVDATGRPVLGTSGVMYSFGALTSIVTCAVVLAANGHPDVWQWGDRAVLRARQALDRLGTTHPYGVSKMVDPVLDKVYGTAFTRAPSEVSYGLTGTEWLTLAPGWPAIG